MILALLVIAGAAVGVWATMEPGSYRTMAWVLLGFFAFRVVLGRARQQQTEAQKQG